MSTGSLRLPCIALSLYCTLCALLSLQPVKGTMDYNCEYSGLYTLIDLYRRSAIQYCLTNMDPAIILRGHHIIANRNGVCYMCICGRTGLACCECEIAYM